MKTLLSPWLNKVLFATTLVVQVACSEPEQLVSEDIVATVGSYQLSRKEIQEDLGINPDSSQVNNYVKSWVKNRICLLHAEHEDRLDKRRIETLTKKYREDLLIRQYLKQVVIESLDTSVTSKQVADFYEKHKQDYVLSENYYLVVATIFPKTAITENAIRKTLRKEEYWKNERFISKLAESGGALLLPDKWRNIGSLLEFMPDNLNISPNFNPSVKIYANEQFVSTIDVLEQHAKGTLAPLPVVADKIRQRILFERRRMIEDRFINKIKKDAEAEGSIRYYN